MKKKFLTAEEKKDIESYCRWLDDKAKKGKMIRKEKKKKKILDTLSGIVYK